MGHIGFSYIGALFLLMLFIPNFIWIKNKPENYNNKNENKVFSVFENIGQITVSCCALLFSDFNIRYSTHIFWLLLAFTAMILYEIWWIKYFKSEKKLKNFYSDFLKIPVAGATLPVIAFLFLGIYGKVIWMIISVVILGIGHIGIHLQHKKDISENSFKKF